MGRETHAYLGVVLGSQQSWRVGVRGGGCDRRLPVGRGDGISACVGPVGPGRLGKADHKLC